MAESTLALRAQARRRQNRYSTLLCCAPDRPMSWRSSPRGSHETHRLALLAEFVCNPGWSRGCPRGRHGGSSLHNTATTQEIPWQRMSSR
ncbi:hypothetical protein GWL_32710 [Herbaspirillum sp. GW103]|nr:hypothetical protein GWL_32710 [Herbaspirillum sp. GW103]